ncbi:RDD family protein [Flavobacterium sp. RHBU_24]|uniref:RDD family protein n=1 Tax=Flavobacterium sp. RHBU_24 TaxID=3391185 RepID=UPI0039855266
MSKPVHIPPAALAPLSKRFLNFFIDTVVLCSMLTLGLSFLGDYLSKACNFDALVIGPPAFGNIKYTLAGAAITIAYYGLFETLLSRTPGKFITDTRVVMADGSKPGNNVILIRTLCRQIPLEAFSFLFMPPMGFHDMLSKTLVVDNYAFERAKQKNDAAPKSTNEL